MKICFHSSQEKTITFPNPAIDCHFFDHTIVVRFPNFSRITQAYSSIGTLGGQYVHYILDLEYPCSALAQVCTLIKILNGCFSLNTTACKNYVSTKRMVTHNSRKTQGWVVFCTLNVKYRFTVQAAFPGRPGFLENMIFHPTKTSWVHIHYCMG